MNERPFMVTGGGTTATAYWLDTPGTPLRSAPLELPEPCATEAIVEVTACGLCHTDLGFANGAVAPKHALPLVLGHEIVGVVTQVGSAAPELMGKNVLVPSVMPCGDCPFCRADRGNVCLGQKMPGNDIHGGFATHILCPASSLVSLEHAPDSIALDSLSVVADAVSTAYQAVARSGLESGDVAFVVGGGGVGGFTAQIAAAMGARVVVCDVDDVRLADCAAYGASATVNVKGRSAKDVRKELHGIAREWGVPSLRWRIFECSGTASGQTQAYALIRHASTLVLVGFTRDRVEVRLSNLMAFDATVHGTWGCPVDSYPAVLKLIYDGKVVVEPFIERAPMSTLGKQLTALSQHKLTRRMVLDPRT